MDTDDFSEKEGTMKAIKAMLQGVTREELREWAGDKIVSRGKSYVSSVSQLSRIEDDALAAWVSGSRKYATSVRRDDEGKLDSICTCPYDGWGPCKHAVAVLLAAADQVKSGTAIPLLDPEDDLYLKMFEDRDDDCDGDEDPADEDEDPDGEDASRKPARGRFTQIESILAKKSPDELLALLIDVARDFPDIAMRIRETAQLETGQIDKLVHSLRKEIRNLTAEDAWSNHWNDEGNIPDFSHVEKQLRSLLDKGHADAVVGLGEDLWKLGVEQVGQSNDEGETAMAIAACMEIVLQALPRSSMTLPDQLLWLIDCLLEDEYGLLDGSDAILNARTYTKAHWQKVATTLEARLEKMELPQSDRFSERYRRERVMKRLLDAYRRSGQKQKVIPLLEREADHCRNYVTLVDALLEAGERERARQWCLKGFEKTIQQEAGTAAAMQKRLRALAEAEGKFDLAVAYRAEDFFEWPSKDTYTELRKAAKTIDAWSAVRGGALDFLLTGKRPAAAGKGKNGWPLPEPEARRSESNTRFHHKSFPDREMLIRIAILEKRNDDAVTLHGDLDKNRYGNRSIDEELAQAVKRSHPEVALQIWKSIADRLIGEVKPKSYLSAATYLRHMQDVFEKTGRIDDWKTLIVTLRTNHKAKRRLMEVLDDLEKNRSLLD